MAQPAIKPFKKGDRPSASRLNEIWSWYQKLKKFTVGETLELVETETSIALRSTVIPPFYAKITGGSNPYSWTRQMRSGTAFVDDPTGMSGTTSSDPAYEVNGNTGVPSGKVVLLRQDITTAQRIFQLENC